MTEKRLNKICNCVIKQMIVMSIYLVTNCMAAEVLYPRFARKCVQIDKIMNVI